VAFEQGGVYFFDPATIFYGGAADLHDRHRDMRLDVDNMSYEVIEKEYQQCLYNGKAVLTY